VQTTVRPGQDALADRSSAGSAAAVDGAELRRWIRWRRANQRSGSVLGALYVGVLSVLVVGSIMWSVAGSVMWPGSPVPTGSAGAASRLAVTALLLVVHATLLAALRRFGPLTLGRAGVSWLLPAPVGRRSLLLPSFRWAAGGSATVAAIAAVAAVGHLAPRPVPLWHVIGGALVGALSGILLACAAMWSQRHERLGRWCDTAAVATVASAVIMLLTDRVVVDSAMASVLMAIGPWGWAMLPPPELLLAALILGALVIVATRRTARSIDTIPDHQVVDTSRTVGSYLDRAYAAEPSLASDVAERRYWMRRRLTSAPLRSNIGLPLLARQDLLMARRKPRRFAVLVGGLALPVLAMRTPEWVGAVVVLLGGLVAASLNTAAIRTDAENPVLLRLLGLSGRQALIARMWVPTALASGWYGAALGALSLLEKLPSGPWWALGLALGPAATVAAFRRARVGAVDNSLPPADTPMGNMPVGRISSFIAGLDVLAVFGLPTALWLATRESLPQLAWSGVAVQGGFSLLGLAGYLLLRSSSTKSSI